MLISRIIPIAVLTCVEVMKLTINDVARSLDLPLSTVERWIRQGRIPIKRSGQTYTVDRTALEKWAKSHKLAFSLQDAATAPGADAIGVPDSETLLSAMKRGEILYGIHGDTTDEVLAAAVGAMTVFPSEVKAELLDRLLERERLTSTGIGKGVAIPHPRMPLLDEIDQSVIVTGFLDKPIDYLAVDSRPVFVLFFLLSPTPKQHLQILSRLSFCVRDDAFVSFLKTIPDPDAFEARIEAFERTMNKKGLV